jgi:hypothetical protein
MWCFEILLFEIYLLNRNFFEPFTQTMEHDKMVAISFFAGACHERESCLDGILGSAGGGRRRLWLAPVVQGVQFARW